MSNFQSKIYKDAKKQEKNPKRPDTKPDAGMAEILELADWESKVTDGHTEVSGGKSGQHTRTGESCMQNMETKNQKEMLSTQTTEMNTFEGFGSRLKTAKERICELEGMSREMFQTEI